MNSSSLRKPSEVLSAASPTERRRSQIYLTRRAEYHVQDGICVSVRDRATGRSLSGHLAERASFSGGLNVRGQRVARPAAGDALLLEESSAPPRRRTLVSARIESVQRARLETASVSEQDVEACAPLERGSHSPS